MNWSSMKRDPGSVKVHARTNEFIFSTSSVSKLWKHILNIIGSTVWNQHLWADGGGTMGVKSSRKQNLMNFFHSKFIEIDVRCFFFKIHTPTLMLMTNMYRKYANDANHPSIDWIELLRVNSLYNIDISKRNFTYCDSQ